MSLNFNTLTLQERVHCRSGHIALAYGDSILVWGGFMEGGHIETDNNTGAPIGSELTSYHYSDEVWQYHHYTELWSRLLTSGEHPPPTSGSCGVILNDSLYVFGGFCHSDNVYGTTNRIYKLHLPTLQWQRLYPTGPEPGACDKLAGWAYGDKVYFFGGYGPQPAHHCGYLFVADPNTQHLNGPGWNNQLVAYEPHTNSWVWPKVEGDTPCPRAAHAADISGDKVYIFGGRFMATRRNDLVCLDYSTMRWSTINMSDMQRLVPLGRSWHSFTFLTPEVAILYGGLDNDNIVNKDCWSINVKDKTFNKLCKPTCIPTAAEAHIYCEKNNLTRGPGRFWHQAALSPGKERVCIVGGTYSPLNRIYKSRSHVEEMLILEFTPKSLLRLSMDAVLKRVPVKCWYGGGVLPKALENILTLRLEQDPRISEI